MNQHQRKLFDYDCDLLEPIIHMRDGVSGQNLGIWCGRKNVLFDLVWQWLGIEANRGG